MHGSEEAAALVSQPTEDGQQHTQAPEAQRVSSLEPAVVLQVTDPEKAGEEVEEQKATKDVPKPVPAEEVVASMSGRPGNEPILSPAGSIEVQDEGPPSSQVAPVAVPPVPPTGAVSSPPAPEQTAKVQELEQKLQQLETKEREWLQLQSLMTQGISAMVQKEENLRQEIAQRDAAFKSKQGLLTGQLEAQLKESCPKVPICYARFGRLFSFR